MIKKIGLKLLTLFVLVFIPYLIVKCHYVWCHDINYYKAISKANHLTIGLSRAKRGFSPAIFEERLALKGKMINFAFDNLSSPFGPAYLDAIQNKVVENERNGIFIISVTPGSILEFDKDKPGNNLREEQFYFYNLWCQNCQPNLEYILRSPIQGGSLFQYLRTNYKAIISQQSSNRREIIHTDGWAELSVEMRSDRLKPLIVSRNFIRSPLREKFLEKTITFLQSHGKVFLVRLPIAKVYQEYEEQLSPKFDSLMLNIAHKQQVDYLNYCNVAGDLSFLDGHHLSGEAARFISNKIAEDIKLKLAQ
ncbi:MAG: hypothetical protein ACI8P3_000237 [Saprospiraceae bacterium]|jgi:hypothetical protein